MKKWRVIGPTILGLIGLGISAGQGFDINRWVLMFWGSAILVATITWIYNSPRIGHRALFEANDRNLAAPTVDAVASPLEISRQQGQTLIRRGDFSQTATISRVNARRVVINWEPKASVSASIGSSGTSIVFSRYSRDTEAPELSCTFEVIEYDRDIRTNDLPIQF